MRKRKTIGREKVRAFWQENSPKLSTYGFCPYVIEAIEDDNEDIKLCWCCGAMGYQEVCHIVPFSLGGKCAEANSFLMCKECHLSSPDTSNPEFFIKWVNSNAGSFSAMLTSTMNDCFEKILKMEEIDVLSINEKLSDSFDKAKEEVSAHGLTLSKSTRLAVPEIAISLAKKNKTT